MLNNAVPVLLLTGYLGSGKTTLLNHILTNQKGIRFAVIVNDIGEVNIDASLIQKGGIVGQKDDSLVALQNGCICCTLKTDLLEQLRELIRLKFDYIVIEASGICEPEPIAQTIQYMEAMGEGYTKFGICKLDAIVTVVDALRMQSEFNNGDDLQRKEIEEDDIENLIIQQIEFCNIILLNKASEVTPYELGRIKQIIRAIQPSAEIIECDYADVELEKLINTGLFNFERVATSAAWIHEIEGHEIASPTARNDNEREPGHHQDHGHDNEHEHEHEHHHGHHHHEGEGEALEYGISTFVYFRRPAFDINRFDRYVAKKWSKNIIRAKGICYFSDNRDMSYLFEQAGVQKKIKEAGLWYATAPEEELIELLRREEGLFEDWDPVYGDRMQKIVFIGQNMDKEQIIRDLDDCLETYDEI